MARNNQVMNNWYDNARTHKSLGSTAARPGSLAGLAKARRENLGQFFTPDTLAALMWRIALPSMEEALSRSVGSKVSLLDTSVGSGRMFQFADPARFSLAGCDVHGPSIDALTEVAEAAGFDVDLVQCGLEDVRPRGHGVALLNPPFSIHIDSPGVMALPGTTYGRFGPYSSAVSHIYAVEQALICCDQVLAILPRSAASHWLDDADRHDRLRAVISLPPKSFQDEGTDVAVDLLVFGHRRDPSKPAEIRLSNLDAALPDFDLSCANTFEVRARSLNPATILASTPTINLPVTGDTGVRITHRGRRVGLQFGCGLTKAKVLNGLLRRPVRRPEDQWVHPRGVKFAGEGLFDLELHLCQADPKASLQVMANKIADLGGTPSIDPGLERYLHRRVNRLKREQTPYRHVIRGTSTGLSEGKQFEATATKQRLMNPNKWGTGVLRIGDSCSVRFIGGEFEVTHPKTNETSFLQEVDFMAAFDLPADLTGGDWVVAHEGRVAAFPALAREIQLQIEREGIIEWIDRDYQLHDLAEMRMSRGGINAWQMALGKTRFAIAMALLGGKNNLIVLEPDLIQEFIDEINKIGLPQDLWQVIRKPGHCSELKRINLVSYNRLRMPVCKGARRTYAALLRRRIATLVADEGDVLTNHTSQQSRALAMVCPRRRYLMTGTPVRNLPRDILGVTTYAGGDGTAVQPYGRHKPYAEQVLLKSMDVATTGAQHFLKNHATLEWVTHEFMDSGLVHGAKREVPKARNIEALRRFAAPLLKRRLQAEPEVARYISIPTPNTIVTELEWDKPHLKHYLRVADQFADWYRQSRLEATGSGSGLNLIALLARVGVVERCATCPQYETPGFGSYGPLTSKQRYLLQRIETLVQQGRKIICAVEQPCMADLLVSQLAQRSIEAVPFHGGIPIAKRVKDMDKRFRGGDAPVMIATKETIQSGYNIPQANYVLFADRNWVARVEEQATFRVLRGEQKNDVDVEFVHLVGGIDIYMDQVVAMKKDTIGACIDFLVPELMNEEFKHMDTIFDEFVENLANRMGFEKGYELRRSLLDAA